MIDTHAHLFLDDYTNDLQEVISLSQSTGITRILMPNVDTSTIDALHKTESDYKNFCYAMMGIHPTSIKSNYVDELKVAETWLKQRSYCAIGEIGIDLYWDKTFLKEQIIAFEEQLHWAKSMNLPVAIHTRESFPYVLESIYKVGLEGLKGVFHSFGGTREEAAEIMKLTNFKMGINGVVTFKKSILKDTLLSVPLDFIVLETDSPYLSPVPYRGKRNQPAYLVEIVNELSTIYGKSSDFIMNQTTKNANQLFNF